MNAPRLSLCVWLLLLSTAVHQVQGRSKSPLMDESDAYIVKKAPECVFGNQVRELGTSWVPDLGAPIGVLYCMQCECVASQRKRRIVARVQCKNIKNECPEPTCAEPVLLKGNCCKSCPGDNYNEIVHDVIPKNMVEDEDKSSKHYAALLTGRSSLVIRNDDLKPIHMDNKNNVVATGRFTFQKRNLYFSFYISDRAARPRSLQFMDADANILEEIILSEPGGTVNSVYQNATRKVCGVWKRLPRDYRRLLKEERLYVVLVWGVKDQSEFMLSGQVNKYQALATELFSALLEPAPGTYNNMQGSGGTAIIYTSTSVTPSIHVAIVFNGIFTPNETMHVPVEVTLAMDDRKSPILRETIYVRKPAHELNLIEISTAVSISDLRLLTRGRLYLSVSSVSNPSGLKLIGNVMTKTTCELFQTSLTPGSQTSQAAGLAWMYLNNEGALVYNIQVDNWGQPAPQLIAMCDITPKRKVELADVTASYANGWANGTIDKISPKVLESLYAGTLWINIERAESAIAKGKLIPKLVADARDSPAPLLLKREDYNLAANVVGLAWVNIDNDCNLHYDVQIGGLNGNDREIEVYLEMLPMIAPGAPVMSRFLSELTGYQVEGSTTEVLKKEELNRLDSGDCFLKIKDKHTRHTLLASTLKQVKVPAACLPQLSDNDVPTLSHDDQTLSVNRECLHGGRFYKDDSSWTSTQDPCTMCYCQNGHYKCDTTTCPNLQCPSGSTKKYNAGECCPVCSHEHPSVPFNNPVSGIPRGCTFGGQFYSSGSKFHPFLIPNGFDFCTECTCDGTEVKCARLNTKKCCKNCYHPAVINSEHGAYLGDSQPEKPLVTTSESQTKSAQQILKEGGCKNGLNPAKPFENGQEFHPFIASLGEYKCVTCKCKNGEHSCERRKCGKEQCHKLFKAQRTKAPSLISNPAESCCSLQECKRYRRHHKRTHNNTNRS